MAADEATIRDIAGIIDIAKQGLISLEITSFAELFDQIETMLKSFDAWDEEIAGNLAIAREQLEANPGLFDEGKQTVIEYLEWLVDTYPPETPLSEIFGSGTGDGDEDDDEDGDEEDAEDGDDEEEDEDEEDDGEEEDEEDSPPDYAIIDGPGDLNIAVLHELFADVEVVFDPDTSVVTVEGAGYSYTLPDVERVQFDDGTLAFDFAGTAGFGYRIYQAAFDREPDAAGLGFWIDILDVGIGLSDVAGHFFDSPEFQSIYGVDLTDEAFVDALYLNTLGREGDEGGVAFWTAALESGLSHSELLVAFAQSDEFAAIIQTSMDDGIWYT